MTIRGGILAPSVGRSKQHCVWPGTLLACVFPDIRLHVLCFISSYFICFLLNRSSFPQSRGVDVDIHFPKDEAGTERPRGPAQVTRLESGRPGHMHAIEICISLSACPLCCQWFPRSLVLSPQARGCSISPFHLYLSVFSRTGRVRNGSVGRQIPSRRSQPRHTPSSQSAWPLRVLSLELNTAAPWSQNLVSAWKKATS